MRMVATIIMTRDNDTMHDNRFHIGNLQMKHSRIRGARESPAATLAGASKPGPATRVASTLASGHQGHVPRGARTLARAHVPDSVPPLPVASVVIPPPARVPARTIPLGHNMSGMRPRTRGSATTSRHPLRPGSTRGTTATSIMFVMINRIEMLFLCYLINISIYHCDYCCYCYCCYCSYSHWH